MNKSVAIVDYGVGNILSVSRAIQHIGGEAKIVDNAKDLLDAKKIILPGVGAFPSALFELHSKKLDKPLRLCVESGRPLLGICLGMQLLLEGSDEFGPVEGLGFIPGWVNKLPVLSNQKLPHIGWTQVNQLKGDWLRGMTSNSKIKPFFYFVHSYHSQPTNIDHSIAISKYGEIDFTSVVQKDNVIGCQFHPEKSAHSGLTFLKNFLEWNI